MAIREVTVRSGLRGTLILQVVTEKAWKTRFGRLAEAPGVNIVTRDACVEDIPELIERGFINRTGDGE